MLYTDAMFFPPIVLIYHWFDAQFLTISQTGHLTAAEVHSVTVLEVGSPRSKCHWDGFLPGLCG